MLNKTRTNGNASMFSKVKNAFVHHHIRLSGLDDIIGYIYEVARHDKRVSSVLFKLVYTGPSVQRRFRNYLDSRKNELSKLNVEEYRHVMSKVLANMLLINVCYSHSNLQGRTKEQIREHSENYISGLIEQLRLVAKKYYEDQDAATSNWSKKCIGHFCRHMSSLKLFIKPEIPPQYTWYTNYWKKFKDQIGGRPCIDNLLEEITSISVGESFSWKGKNTGEVYNTVNKYHKLINGTINPLVNTFNTASRSRFNAANARGRATIIWNLLRNQQIHTRNQNGAPYYQVLSAYNVNGRILKNRVASILNF
jgi:hypothetical protein